MAKNIPTPTELATSLGLRNVDTDRVINMIANDTLLLMHRQASPEMKKKIEKVWQEWHPNGTWEDDNEQVTSILLVGPPGHGKTTSFKEASKKVARALGMQFLENADLDAVDKIDPEKHFVFVSQEAAGVVSALEWLGLPTKQRLKDADREEDQSVVMGRLYSARLIKAQNALGACVLLDDFLNAQPGIQNVGLPLSEEHRYNDLNLTHCYIGLTGNLGAQDGTTTNGISSALRNRTRMLFIQDQLSKFELRAQERYRDQIGDALVTSFLGRHDECFTEWPDPAKKGPYATPRSWDKFTVLSRRAVRENGSLKAAVADLVLHAQSTLGPVVAQKYEGYVNAYVKSADPIAQDIINKGEWNKAVMEKKTAEALSGDGQAFFYQLGSALADYATKKVLKDGDHKPAMRRLVQGLMLIQDQSSMNAALDNFKRVLAIKSETLSHVADGNRRELKPAIKQDFCDILVAHDECTEEIRGSLIRVLSNSAQFETAQTRRQRRVGGK